MNPSLLFDSLVKNAIDFLDRSLDEFSERPKYSIMNFYQAIELFVKACLMCEHWSLIISKVEEADYDSFLAGNFQSVTLNLAIQRLTKIAKDAPSTAAKKSFDQMRDHRNKLAHFFHSDYGTTPSKETLQTLIAEQCKGWYYLHELLTCQWSSLFSTHAEAIADLGKRMHRHREFLSAKFDGLDTNIQQERSRGTVFTQCSSCGFEAAREEHLFGPLVSETCLVCTLQKHALKLSCPTCQESLYVYEMGRGKCQNCQNEITLSDVLGFAPQSSSFKNELIAPMRAYCSECEHTEEPTVIAYGDQSLCLNCFSNFLSYEVGICGYCNERVTGSKGTPHQPACCMCAVYISAESL